MVFTNTQSKFLSAVFDGVLGPPHLEPHLTASLFLCSSESNARGPLKGAVSAQKALQRSERETIELLGLTEENFPDKR